MVVVKNAEKVASSDYLEIRRDYYKSGARGDKFTRVLDFFDTGPTESRKLNLYFLVRKLAFCTGIDKAKLVDMISDYQINETVLEEFVEMHDYESELIAEALSEDAIFYSEGYNALDKVRVESEVRDLTLSSSIELPLKGTKKPRCWYNEGNNCNDKPCNSCDRNVLVF